MTAYNNAQHDHSSRYSCSTFLRRCILTTTSIALSCALGGTLSTGTHPSAGADTAKSAGITTSLPVAAAAGKTSAAQSSRTLSIDSASSIITSDSGYTARFAVTNTSHERVPEGTVSLSTAPSYDFLSSDYMDKWAQGELKLRTALTLAQVSVPALDAGESTQVNVKLEPTNSALVAMTTWGAKPLLVNYISSNGELSDTVHTFVTRSNAGTYTQNLPAINFVVALPVSTASIPSCSQSSLLNQDARTTTQNLLNGAIKLSDTNTASRTSCASTTLSALSGLLAQHPQLQLLTDNNLSTLARADYHLNPAAIIQNSGIDITALSNTQLIDALPASQLARANQTAQSQGDNATSSTPSLALDGLAGWSADALKSAQKLGYSTVMATDGFNSTVDGAVHNSVAQTSVDGSDMKVLIAQKELSTLAQGRPTSSNAVAEQSTAGLINRFIAQTAFYETQAPYEHRTVLINAADPAQSFDADHISYMHSLMSALSSASWAQLSDMNALMNAQSAYSQNEVADFIASASSTNETTKTSLHSIAQSIQKNTARLDTLFSSVVSSAELEKKDKKSRNPQDLANGTANRDHTLSKEEFDSWRETVNTLANSYAVQALSSASISSYSEDSHTSAALTAMTTVTNNLVNSVSISVPQSLHVVSETASLPVTVSNKLPVALKLNIATKSSEKVSSEVVISGKKDVLVDAHSEQQVILPVHAISGWSTEYAVYLTTPDSAEAQGSEEENSAGENQAGGNPAGSDSQSSSHNSTQPATQIGERKTIKITSSFTILDNAGYAIFGLSVVLAILGAKRQITRKGHNA